MYYIYVFTNLLNNKKYVGQTSDPARRLREHKSVSFNPKSDSYDTVFHKALRKYGFDNFTFKVIASAESQDEINELEKEYIQKLDTLAFNGKGYNIEPGGTERKDPYGLIYSPEVINNVKRALKENKTYD